MRAPDDLRAFCEAVQGKLTRTISLYCGDREIARDLTQEALARACRDWRRVRRMGNPEAWVYRVAFNLANSHFRRLGIRRRVEREFHERFPTATAEEGASREAVRAAIRKLNRRQRLALVLRYYADWPVKEVATVMGCPEGTVKTLTARALECLRRDLEKGYQEEDSDVR